MKGSRSPRSLEDMAGHYFERMLSQGRAIGREQNAAVALRQIEGVTEQFLKTTFNLKRLSSGRSRKSWCIENDCIEFLSVARQSRQHRHHVVGDETMIGSWQAVQRKIFPTSRQGFLGEIDIESGRSYIRGADRKGAGIGKTVQ